MESLHMKGRIAAPAARVFAAWMDETEHAAFTGSPARFEEGGAFSAWDGYITGKTIEVELDRRVLQRWRTTDFPAASPDSLLELLFIERPDGCEVVINQSDIPEGQAEEYRQGWKDYYLKPLAEWLSRL